MLKWLKRIIIGLLVVLIPLGIFIFVLGGIMQAVMAPQKIKNDKELEAEFKIQINKEYGISLEATAKTEHFSYWMGQSEAGYDLVLSAKTENLNHYIPKDSSIKVITPGANNEFRNADFLCDGEELEIEKQEVKKQICGLVSSPYPLPVATHRVRSDWVVFVVFFSEKNLVWIKETEW